MQEFMDILTRGWTDLLARPSGPMGFRFVLQPLMATIFAIRDGIKDAKTGRSPYFWTIVSDPAKRRDSLRDGVRSTSRVMLLGMVMDVIYQLRLFSAVYTLELISVVLALAFLPYLLIRGPAARIARWWMTRETSRQ